MTTAKRKLNQISVDEISLYDRQIRLWGLKAQENMRNSRILAIGITGLMAEALKNICLAGIGHLTLMDEDDVQVQDLTNFLVEQKSLDLNKAAASLDRLKSLNPRVDIVVSKDTVMEASAEFYNSFDIVCMSGCNPLEMIHVNKICHCGKVKFFAAENMGFHSYIFSDLIEHSFSTEMKRTGYGKEEIVKNTRTDTFESLDVVMKRKFGFASEKSMRKWKRVAHPLYFALLVLWKFYLSEKRYPLCETVNGKQVNHSNLQAAKNSKFASADHALLEKTRKEILKAVEVDEKFLPFDYLLQIVESKGYDINPASAIVGGFLGQEILKVLAQKEVPFNNFFLHDAMEATGFMMKV